MKKNSILSLVLTLVLLVSYSGNSNSSSSNAPASVISKSYLYTITSGTGIILANTGTFTVQFNPDGNFIIAGDGANVGDASGIYTYSASGNIGTVVFTIPDGADGIIAKYILTYSSATTGTFTATIDGASDEQQKGTFVEK